MDRRSMADRGPSPKYEKRRLEVLKAAARTFNRLGFHSAGLGDVAQDLGISKPAIYYYTKSKDALLLACTRLAIEALDRALKDSAELKLSAIERLSRFFALYAEIICEDFGRCLVLTEPRDFTPKSRKYIIESGRSLNLAIREIIEAGIASGEIRSLNSQTVALVLFDAFNGLARWFNKRGPEPLSKIVDLHLEVLLRGIIQP